MAASNRRTKDQEMAQMMKRQGIERRSQRCPTCYQMTPNGTFEPVAVYTHALNCPGPRRKVSGKAHNIAA